MHAPFTLIHAPMFDAQCIELFGSAQRADAALASLMLELATSVNERHDGSYASVLVIEGWTFSVEISVEFECEGVAVLAGVVFRLRRAA